ncbi:hypothetical protein CPB85DRAFT_1288524 [Mucidula mucida]|nr:hypothetical protein CPB85DRAFT_1288524 [Mucidula mucida]
MFFPHTVQRNSDHYTYTAGRKKEVVLMGTKAFANFLVSIKGHIGTMISTVGILERQVKTSTADSFSERAQRELEQTERQLSRTRTAIEELKKFYVKIKIEWTRPKDRVIGHVVWAPPVSFSTAPYGYSQDVCVIKLDKEKFSKNFKGNVLNLGPEIDARKFRCLMRSQTDARFDLDYLVKRLYKIRGILNTKELRTPTTKGEPIQYVIKCGLNTRTTIGCLNGFESHVRRYFLQGSRDSVEQHEPVPFARRGDSGSIIVDTLGRFVALLGAGTDYSDVTYASPMFWLWETIKVEFPGADLCFEDGES